MAYVTVSPSARDYPLYQGAGIVYVKKRAKNGSNYRYWKDGDGGLIEWEPVPDMYAVSGSAVVAGRGLGRFELVHRYGRKKEPYESAFGVDPVDRYLRHWIKIELIGDLNQSAPLWYGRIPAETREVYGDEDPDCETGIQKYTAYGPLRELDQEPINGSYWVDEQELKFLGWCPVFNRRDDHNMLLGNCTATHKQGSFHFGGTQTWTRYDILEYILNHFTPDYGPEWDIAGEIDMLKTMIDVVNIPYGSMITDAIKTIIPKKYGYDFDIVPRLNEDEEIEGFTLQVFSTAMEDHHFAGFDLAKNKHQIRVDMNSKEVLSRSFEKTTAKQYNSIRVTGERIVICCTLKGSRDSAGDERSTYDLVKKWTDAQQAAYEGIAGDDAKEKDRYRREPQYENVFSAIGAHDAWGFAGPLLDSEGEVTGTGASYQTTVRETLHLLPLRKGFDYTVNPADNENPDGFTPDFLRPLAFIWDEENEEYVCAEQIGANIAPLQYDWGLQLIMHDNHILGKNTFDGTATNLAPRYDYRKIVMTIALKADHKLAIHKELDPDGEKTLDIQVRGAELWYLAADTVVGVDGGQLGQLSSSEDEGRVLRNDADKLKPILLGAIAEYQASLVRGEFVMKGWQPWRYYLGRTCTPYQEGSAIADWISPFTSITWNEDGTTTIGIGYA